MAEDEETVAAEAVEDEHPAEDEHLSPGRLRSKRLSRDLRLRLSTGLWQLSLVS